MRRLRINYLLNLGSLLLFLTTNCTKDSDVKEIQNDSLLKCYYTGDKLENTGKINDAKIEIIIPDAENWNGIYSLVIFFASCKSSLTGLDIEA